MDLDKDMLTQREKLGMLSIDSDGLPGVPSTSTLRAGWKGISGLGTSLLGTSARIAAFSLAATSARIAAFSGSSFVGGTVNGCASLSALSKEFTHGCTDAAGFTCGNAGVSVNGAAGAAVLAESVAFAAFAAGAGIAPGALASVPEHPKRGNECTNCERVPRGVVGADAAGDALLLMWCC